MSELKQEEDETASRLFAMLYAKRHHIVKVCMGA